jgi:hypothetical protein
MSFKGKACSADLGPEEVVGGLGDLSVPCLKPQRAAVLKRVCIGVRERKEEGTSDLYLYALWVPNGSIVWVLNGSTC